MEKGNAKNYPKRTNAKTVIAILWTCVCVGLLIYTVVHPRALHIAIELFVILQTTNLWMKEHPVILKVLQPLFVIMIITTILFAFPINSRHAKWEYKGDIKEFKSQYPEEFQAFPDALPEGAEEVRWLVVPGFMQGAPYELLVFDAPLGYIEEVVGKFESKASRYVYDKEYGGLGISFPYYGYLAEPENTEIYILYDNGDNNHRHFYGFWVNRCVGEIGFFEE